MEDKEIKKTAEDFITIEIKPRDLSEGYNCMKSYIQGFKLAGSLNIFKCKCGFETPNSTDWCIHADCCTVDSLKCKYCFKVTDILNHDLCKQCFETQI